MPSPRPRTNAPRNQRRVHYVLSTHWDREWLQPFQVFRHRLVRLMDRTLAALKNGELRGPFTTDGQSILIEDYLEVRPKKRPLIESLARKGKLNIGPWYTMPDEWLISGESFVRNLRLGRQIARDVGGKPSDAGFVCDLFGHISQLPQIFAGFGVKGVLLWRGIEPRAAANFIWEGADGTRLPAYRFGRAGYGDYAYNVRRGTQLDTWFEPARSRKDHLEFIAREAERSAVPPVLVFDGCDHLQFDSDHYRVLQGLTAADGLPGPLEHGTLDDYLDDLKRHAAEITDVVHGELREYGAKPLVEDQQWLIPGVLTSRVPLKQANAYAQNLLCHWAEPFGHMAQIFAGGEDPADFLTVAWRWLLQNHPHDSIGGCCIDEVHEDMKFRFAQCHHLGDRITGEALRLLAASAEGKTAANEIRVLVANPLPRAQCEIVELTLQIPAEWRYFNEFFGFEPKPGFRIFTADGIEIPYQRLAQQPDRTKYRAASPFKFPVPYKTNDVTVALRLEIPAVGYTVLTVREGELAAHDEIVSASILPTRYSERPGMATSERSMKNEFLAAVIETNGTVTLTDKRTGNTYSRLLTFEDTADIGDGWYHGPALNDLACVSTAARSDVALVHNGPLLTRFRIRTTLRVPAEFQFDRMVRSERLADLVIDSLVSLRAGVDQLEVVTTVHNNVCDHRLRVFFPTGARCDTYLADGAFDVIERAVALPAEYHLGRELAVESGPQQTWSAAFDETRGLAVVAPGLLDCCVRDLPERPLALTLLRGTRRTVMSNGQPGGQILGEHVFHYAVRPLRGAPDRVALCERALQIGAGLRTAQLNDYDIRICPRQRTLPAAASLFQIAGPVVVTSSREIDAGFEVRLFNPNPEVAEARIDFAGRPATAPIPRKAQPVNLESQTVGDAVPVRDGSHAFSVRPKQILTLRFT